MLVLQGAVASVLHTCMLLACSGSMALPPRALSTAAVGVKLNANNKLVLLFSIQRAIEGYSCAGEGGVPTRLSQLSCVWFLNAIATFIVRPQVPHCKVMDGYICRAFTATRAGCFGITLSHFLLAPSASLQDEQVDDSVRDICDASPQAFAYQTRELGQLMSTLVHTRRHVWLVQSPLTEATRTVLCRVPAEPGELFGSAAL